jgi:hypothetical protein
VSSANTPDQEQPTELQSPRVSLNVGLATGLSAGLIMTVLLVALRFTMDTVVYPEVMADWLTQVTPGAIFDFALENLQVKAKPLMFVGLLAGQVAVGAALGGMYTHYSPQLPLDERKPWRRGFFIGTVLWLITMCVATPATGGGFFGGSLPTGSWEYSIAAFLSLAAYGTSLTHLHHIALSQQQGSHDAGRREFVQRAVFFTLLIAVGGYALRAITSSYSRLTSTKIFSNLGELPEEVTPNDMFYEVSKNIVDPQVDVSTWKLEISGDVGNPFSLTYDELMALPWKEQYVTLTCISNPIGNYLISNALWRGVPLATLLAMAGLPETAERIAFHSADGYVDSFPVEYAMRDNVLVAYLMNGEPLSDAHGFPARVIVPGLYGMENVKWLTRIEPVEANFRGYWQKRGWADTAVIRTMSRIDVPSGAVPVTPSEVMMGGVAFAGDRGLTTVEISVDDGRTWQPAEVREALSPYTWVIWTSTWSPPSTSRYYVSVRATDGDGEVQTGIVRGTYPSGASGHHERELVVEMAQYDQKT